MIETTEYPVEEVFLHLLMAPVEHSEIVPQILPLLAGLLVMEFYFGKHKQESLGWNTAVGNAVVWAASGLALLYDNAQMPPQEMWLAFLLIGAGGFILYMDFYHLWPKEVAWRISSSIAIYLVAYVIVILVETPIPVNEQTLYGAGVFALSALVGLKAAQMMMQPIDRTRI